MIMLKNAFQLENVIQILMSQSQIEEMMDSRGIEPRITRRERVVLPLDYESLHIIE